MSKKALRRKRRRQKYFLCAACGAMALLAVTLCVLIMTTPTRDAVAPVGNNYALALEPTVGAPVPTAEPTVEPTAVPTPEPTIEPTQAPDESFEAIHPEEEIEAEATFEYLPVIHHADTTEKRIAITVDDCFQAGNLRTIVQTAIDNGAKLTIFPIGEVALREKQTEILKWAWDNGMELENHTFTHNGLYNASDELLAKEIYYQNLALSKILGVEYHAHFLRPKGGDARNDERMHAYARQMGYYGIAHWTISGSGSTPSKLASTLAPGNIYLFHTTDKTDFEKLCGFIPYAVSQGYTLVTLNEMFGYPDNETEPLTTPIEEHQPPALEPYQITLIPLEKGSYDYRVYRLQEKLRALGCTKDEPDGIYGKGTVEAVKKFQKKAGLEVTGKADVATQEKAFGM